MIRLIIWSRRRPERNACDDRGATAVEYAMMVGFIAAVIVIGVTAFGKSVRGLFELIPPNLFN